MSKQPRPALSIRERKSTKNIEVYMKKKMFDEI